MSAGPDNVRRGRIPAALLGRSRSLADPTWSPGGERLAWIEGFDGRSDVVVAPADGSGPAVVVTAETGGSSFAWATDDVLVVAGADGRLAVVHACDGLVRHLTRDGRAQRPAVSARGEVAFVLERDDACDVAVVPLDGGAWPVRMSSADFAWDPAWSRDGSVLVWHEWDLPAMPWDSSRIAWCDREGSDARTIAGGDGVSVGQPRFSPDGRRLAWVSDEGGFANLWVAAADGSDAVAVLPERHEHAEPAWSPGQRSFAWSPDGTELVWCRNEDGFARLVIGAPGRRSARELSRGWHRGLSWSEHGIVAVRSGAVTPDQVVVLEPNGSGRVVRARGPAGGFEGADLLEPRAVSWKSQNATVHGLLYRPRDAARAPMIVHVHGGPTGQAIVDWNARIQYLCSRGWTVLSVNHRGSTGYGREYLRALDGEWGEHDVADVASGIRHAVKEGWADPDRVAVTGGSAGGFTALLCAARHPGLVAAVAVLYPVTDLFDLAETTYRFESGYCDRLVGPLPEAAGTYRRRSPVAHATAIRAPVLVLQGAQDQAVPPAQAAALVEALRGAGTVVEHHVYDDEGHGFRRAATVADEIERIEGFFARWVLRRRP